MTDLRVGVPTGRHEIGGAEPKVKPSTGHDGLDSVIEARSSDKMVGPTMPPAERPQVGLNSVVGRHMEHAIDGPLGQDLPLGGAEDDVEPAIQRSSPFSTDRGAIGPGTASPMAGKTLPETWATRMDKHAKGTSGSFWVGPHQTEVRAMKQELSAAAGRAAGDGMMRSVELGKALATMIQRDYTAEGGLSDGAGKLRQAHMSLVSLVEHARSDSTPTTKEDVLRSVMLLNLTDRHALLEADLAGSKALTGLLYEAMDEVLKSATATPNEKADVKALFQGFKAASDLAYMTLKLDAADPTGQASALLGRFTSHLEDTGVGYKALDSFASHLAFQAKLQDLQMPDTGRANWRQDFTADLMARFAAISERGDGDLTALLDLPRSDLMEVIGHAMGVRMEGDVHILRTLRDNMDTVKARFGDDSAAFEAVFKGLESGAYDAELMTAQLRSGSDLATIRDRLDTRLDEKVTAALALHTERLNEAVEKSVDRFVYLSARKGGEPAPAGDALAKINSELGEIKAFLSEFNPSSALDRMASLQALKDGDPTTLLPAAGGEFLAKIEAELGHLAVLRDALADAPGDGFAFSKESFIGLARRFGTDALERTQTAITYSSTSDAFRQTASASIDSFRQLKFHAEALADPTLYKTGLATLSPVLPTYGKDLAEFHHIDSMVQGLIHVADEIRKGDVDFSLADSPIIILDQTDGDGSNAGRTALWDKNDQYLQSLENKYGESHGLKIVHVKMQDIERMIDGSGVKKLFDTTGQSSPGYGGARNMGFLLGPVIRETIRSGEHLTSITPENLIAKIKEHALGEDAPRIFMGDDTDYLGPGAMFSKIGLNALHGDEYYTAVSRRDGRDTTAVASLVATGSINNLDAEGTDSFVRAFANSKFNSKLATPGMGSIVSAPRFCFDIPTGAEESHHKAMFNYKDQLGTVRHLSGDRMRDGPGQVAGFLNYAIGTETFVQFGSIASTWNGFHVGDVLRGGDGFKSLNDVLTDVSNPASQKENTKDAMKRLASWASKATHPDGPTSIKEREIETIDRYLQAHPDLDSESKAQLESVKATFENASRQGALVEGFVRDFVKRLVPMPLGTMVP